MRNVTFQIIRAGKRFREQEFRSGRCHLLSICRLLVVYLSSYCRLFFVFLSFICRLSVVFLSSICHLFVFYLSSICLLLSSFYLLFVVCYLSSVSSIFETAFFAVSLCGFETQTDDSRLTVFFCFYFFWDSALLQLSYKGLKLKPSIIDLLWFHYNFVFNARVVLIASFPLLAVFSTETRQNVI